MGFDKFLEYLVKGALLITSVAIAAVFLAPFVLGYVLAVILWRIIDFIQDLVRKLHEPRPERFYISKETLREQELMRQRRSAEERKQMEIERAERLDREKKEREAKWHEIWCKQQEDAERRMEEIMRKLQAGKNVLPEKHLSQQRKEELFAQGFKRLKISPFGDSGASHYWVKTRYNESKKHAFFCYLIEEELKKFIKDVRLNVNNGPDVEFELGDKKYCFEIETGASLKRNRNYVKNKFAKYKQEYDKIFIFVTSKKLKYSYPKYGKVITRSTLKKTITQLFSKHARN